MTLETLLLPEAGFLVMVKKCRDAMHHVSTFFLRCYSALILIKMNNNSVNPHSEEPP